MAGHRCLPTRSPAAVAAPELVARHLLDPAALAARVAPAA